MGCTQSKIENEEAVTRCKERKQFMKEAVQARNAFAAAHSGYAMSLKNTGAALSDYAHGEVQNPQIPSQSNPVAPPSQTSFDTLPPPPPPLPNFPPSPLQRAASMPEFQMPKVETKVQSRSAEPTIEEEDENEAEIDNEVSLGRRSSRKSGGGGVRKVLENVEEPPPAPPRQAPQPETRTVPPPQPQQDSAWDYFFPSVDNMPGPSLSDEVVEEVKIDKSKIERKPFDEKPKRVGESDEPKRSVKHEAPPAKAEEVVEPLPHPVPASQATGKAAKKVKMGAGGVPEGKRTVKANVNLLQIFTGLDDHFLKASESAHEVSKMLEATRLHYHSNFADNRGHIDHSARVMRVITWNRSFRGGVLNTDDGKDDFDSEEHETHATVLDKLLAWEKKLYDEVKAGELMKIEYQRKVATLNKHKNRGTNSEALEKAKAAVSHLHTRYIVDMQSMDSTVSEINRLRDEQLYPKLVQLVDGMAKMWETMRDHHKSQSNIVEALKFLDISQSPKETSVHHHECTMQLFDVLQVCHSQFEKLVKQQKEYIRNLNSWLKLNLIPIESSLKENVSSPPRIQRPPIQALLLSWQDQLDKLPDEIARTAINNFTAVIETIMHHQEEELKLREKIEETQKELAKKTRLFEDWYNKYMQKRMPEEMDPERSGMDTIAEKQFAVEVVKKRLEEEGEAYQRQCIQVREKSLTSLKTRLPETFETMSQFAAACLDMYSALRSISQQRNRTESSS